jgi:pyrroloquinoline quinone biosynthesis protein B
MMFLPILVASFMKQIILIICVFLVSGCLKHPESDSQNKALHDSDRIVILGIAQDGGYPQAGCKKDCCKAYYQGTESKKLVASLGVIDASENRFWIIDATPDFPEQLRLMDSLTGGGTFSGIFLTHAHIGHYAGLIHLGREVMGSKSIPVYVMPGMKNFLSNHGPWEQLVKLENIHLITLKADSEIRLTEKIQISPFLVPHRDEYSETVGFQVSGPGKSLVYIPDIDKWEKWNQKIKDVIELNDYVLVDGTFYQEGEIPGRNMAEIPHPFITESMDLFKDLDITTKNKVYFTHFNHTNPVIRNTHARNQIQKNGFKIVFPLQQFLISN